MSTLWSKNGTLVVDAGGHPIMCDACPCNVVPPAGTANGYDELFPYADGGIGTESSGVWDSDALTVLSNTVITPEADDLSSGAVNATIDFEPVSNILNLLPQDSGTRIAINYTDLVSFYEGQVAACGPADLTAFNFVHLITITMGVPALVTFRQVLTAQVVINVSYNSMGPNPTVVTTSTSGGGTLTLGMSTLDIVRHGLATLGEASTAKIYLNDVLISTTTLNIGSQGADYQPSDFECRIAISIEADGGFGEGTTDPQPILMKNALQLTEVYSATAL